MTTDGRTRETARPRPAARVVLLDADDRVLLIRAEWDGQSRWFTPGGGIEPGETPEQAARRELREETGLDDWLVRWDGLCWLREWTWHWSQNDTWYDTHEHYYLARMPVTGGALPHDKQTLTDEEILLHQETRWWSLEELRAESPPTSPLVLADLLHALIEGGSPAEPLRVGQ